MVLIRSQPNPPLEAVVLGIRYRVASEVINVCYSKLSQVGDELEYFKKANYIV